MLDLRSSLIGIAHGADMLIGQTPDAKFGEVSKQHDAVMKSFGDPIDTLEENGTDGPVTTQTIRARMDDIHHHLSTHR